MHDQMLTVLHVLPTSAVRRAFNCTAIPMDAATAAAMREMLAHASHIQADRSLLVLLPLAIYFRLTKRY